MVTLNYKSKQYLWALLKVVVLAFVFWFIYNRLAQTDFQTWEHFKNRTLFDLSESKWILLTCFVLTVLNWVFEIFKWQQLVSHISKISFLNSTRETLAGSTLTFITPAKLGEYGIKAGYYSKVERSKILITNGIGNGIQLIVTIFFGAIACSYFLLYEEFSEVNRIASITLIIGVLATLPLYALRNKKMIRVEFTLTNIITIAKSLKTSVKLKVITLSFLRYFCFSFCFYLLLRLFGGNITFIDAIAPIFAMYFFSSLLPSFFIIDAAVKGGIAAYLLSFYDVALIPVLCAALAMWLLNFAFPALLGSYYVFTFKPQTTA